MNYFNSTVERKTGKCLDCGNDTYLTAGRCSIHYSTYRKKLMIENQKEKSKLRSLIQSPNNKKMLVENELIEDAELQLWYKMQMQANEKICDNCGLSLNHYKDKDWRGSQHHIFMKSLFPSVSTHPCNHLVLGMWCCHSVVTNLPSKIKDMKCFELAKQRVALFINEVAESEKRKIEDFWY